MDMETYEIDLWEFFKILNNKKVFIIGFVCISIIATLLISYFFIEKQYQSEIWIKLNQNSLYNQKEIPYSYLKTYFMNPEITQFTFNDDLDILRGLKDRFSLKNVDSILKVEFTHPFRSNISQKLLKWMNTTRIKLILDEGPRVISTMENEILSNQMLIQNMQQNFRNLINVLKEEEQYVSIEVFPKDVVNPQTFVYKEINPSYTELRGQAMQTELKIKALEVQNFLLQNILEDYNSTLSQIEQVFNSNSPIESNIFEKLKKIQTNYLTYLKEIRTFYLTDLNQNYETGSYYSLVPFEIITEPCTTAEPISPNTKLNSAIAGFLALIISIFFIFFWNYIEEEKKVETKITAF